MYVMNGSRTYTAISNLQFSPQVDLTNENLPINEYSVDIATTNEMDMSPYLDLYDDLDNLWAHYPIYRADRVAANVVRVRARSELQWLDDVTLPEIMYDGDALVDIMDNVMVCSVGAGLVTTIDYTLDSSLEQVTVTGYCPEQTARERLQWILNVTGAYIKTFFNSEPEILPVDNTTTLIPLYRTFVRPNVDATEYVSAVRVTAYAFTQGQQTETDILSDNTSYPFPLPWIATEQVYELANSVTGDTENVVEIEGVYLVNSGNVSGLLGRLAARHFKGLTVDLDVVNNAEYLPGERVTVYADANTLYTGNIESAAFKFGKQARSTLHLTAVEVTEGAALTINYVWNDMTVALETYTLPVGYTYSIQTRYIDTQINGHRYILRPTTATVSGTMTSAGAAVTVTCETALDLFEGVLHVISVDGVTMNQNTAVIE